MFRDSPTFDNIYTELREQMNGEITGHHIPVDKIAVLRACEEYE